MESAKLKHVLWSLALAFALGACGDDETEGEEPRPGNFDLRIRGMEGTAEVSFDEHGILHARCLTDGDCLRVLGYFHASSRFFQMDLQRRAARGRLATLIPTQVGMDIEFRALFSTPLGEPLEEEIWRLLSAEERDLLEAYAQGVNAWLEDLRAGRNGARLSEEYEVSLVHATPETIPDWEPLDTVAFARLMTFMLSDSHEHELRLGSAFANLAQESVEAALDFFSPRPAAKVYTLPASQAAAQALAAPEKEGLQRLAERLAAVRSLLDSALAERADRSFLPDFGEGFGSNNWVLAPSRTRAGKAILANDPHLELSNPPVFYLAHLDAVTVGRGTLHVAGASFPGIPAIVIGRNERVAWGATVAFFDVMDIYVEQLSADGRSVIFEGEEVEIVRKEVPFQIAGKDPLLVTLEWVPHHGPIIQKDAAAGTALSLRWTGHEPSNELRAFLGLNRAGSVEEAREALRSFEVGAQNFVLADVEGSIGWYPHARIPSRPWASYSQSDPGSSLPPWMPLPGDGSAEWDGYLDEEALPKAFDPPTGYIATANQDLTGETESGDPTSGGPMLQSIPAPGIRMARIVEFLEAGGNDHTVESSLALQLDTHSLLGEWIVPRLLAATDEAELSPTAETMAEVLRRWEYSCPTGLSGSDPQSAPHADEEVRREAQGCAAFHVYLPRLMEAAFATRHAISGVGTWNANHLVRPLVLGLFRPEELQQSPEAFWSDLREEPRTEEEVLVEALEAASLRMGPWGAPENWLWGRRHTVTFTTQFSQVEPSLDLGPFAAPGGLFTVNVANPSVSPAGGFAFSSGASLRIVNELGEEGIVSWVQLPGGQDLHRDSPHYGDLIEDWLEGRSIRIPFKTEEVALAAQATLRVGY